MRPEEGRKGLEKVRWKLFGQGALYVPADCTTAEKISGSSAAAHYRFTAASKKIQRQL